MRFYSIEPDIFNSSFWHFGDVPEIDNWRLVSPPMLPMDDPIRDQRFVVSLKIDGIRTGFTTVGYAAIPMLDFKALQAISGFYGFTALPVLLSGCEQGDSYHLLHVWDVVDCFDEQRSKFEIFSADDPIFADRAGDYHAVTKLTIDPDRALGKHIFRLDRLLDTIIVSEEVKHRFEAMGVTGNFFFQQVSP